jgi:cation diffusion facilitator family transporter
MQNKKINFSSPYFCMTIVIIAYIIKISVKFFIAAKISSVSVYSDALHNLSDVLEALLVIFAIYLARQPETAKYPIGKSSIESIGSLLIGTILFILGISFFLKSILGIFIYFNILPFVSNLLLHIVDMPARIDLSNNAFLVMFLIAGSVILSWTVSLYQIRTGKKTKHDSLISDGKETLSDSFVELAVLIGIIGVFLGLGYLDYIFGTLVSIIILKTAGGIVKSSGENLLQKSINQQEIKEIKKIIHQTKGVEGFDEKGEDRIMAYRLGKFVFIFIKVYISPSLSPQGFYMLKKAIKKRIDDAIPESNVRIYLRQSVKPEKIKRAIIPVCKKDKNPLNAFIEEDFSNAESFYIVDLVGERIVSVKQEKNRFKNKEEIAEFIKRKRADIIYTVKRDRSLENLLPNIKIERTNFLIFRNLFH